MLQYVLLVVFFFLNIIGRKHTTQILGWDEFIRSDMVTEGTEPHKRHIITFTPLFTVIYAYGRQIILYRNFMLIRTKIPEMLYAALNENVAGRFYVVHGLPTNNIFV